MKKRIFILETGKFPEQIRKNLEGYSPNGNLEITSSTSEENYRRHLPRGYDLYLLHVSNTEEEAMEELRREQPWSKIFVRKSIRPPGKLPSLIKELIDGVYEVYDISTLEYFKEALKSIGIEPLSDEEMYKKTQRTYDTLQPFETGFADG